MIRKAHVLTASLGFAAAMLACSSSSSTSSASPWAGTYSCAGTQTAMLTAPTMTTVNGMIAFDGAVTQNGNAVTATAEPGDSGNPPCTLQGTVSGNTFTLGTSPAQSCSQMTTLGSVTIAYTSGTATLSGTMFAAMFSGTLSGAASGTGTQSFTCTRM